MIVGTTRTRAGDVASDGVHLGALICVQRAAIFFAERTLETLGMDVPPQSFATP